MDLGEGGAGGGGGGLLRASISSFTKEASAAVAAGRNPVSEPPVATGTSERTVLVIPPALNADSTGTVTTEGGRGVIAGVEKTGRAGRGANSAASSPTSDSGIQSAKPCRQVRLS